MRLTSWLGLAFYLSMLTLPVQPEGASDDAQAFAVSLSTPHQSPAFAVVFHPDGETLAVGSEDGKIQLWNVATSRLSHVYRGHEDGILAAAFSPDGETLASGSYDMTLRLWGTGGLSRVLGSHDDWISSVAFSPDGEFTASGSFDCTVQLWDSDGQLIGKFREHNAPVRAVAFHSSNKTLISGAFDGTVRIWDLDSRQLRRTLFLGSGEIPAASSCGSASHPMGVLSMALAPDGKWLAVGSMDGAVRLWWLASEEPELFDVLRGHEGEVLAVAVNADGKTLVSGSVDGTVRIWDVDARDTVATIREDGILSVAFSPDGHRLASGSRDGTVRIRDVASLDTIRTYTTATGHPGLFSFDEDGNVLGAVPDGGDAIAARNKDGTLDVVPLASYSGTPVLEIINHPAEVVTDDGQMTPFMLTVYNAGQDRVSWIEIARSRPAANDGLILKSPTVQVHLDPGESVKIACGISVRSARDNPQSVDVSLNLVVKAHGGLTFSVPTIAVRSRVPSFQWMGARWSQPEDDPALTARIENVGPLEIARGVRVIARSAEFESPLNAAAEELFPGRTETFFFAIPDSFNLRKHEAVSLTMIKREHPVHTWTFAEMSVHTPWARSSWLLLSASVVTAAAMLSVLLLVLSHPLLRQISDQPSAIRQVHPLELHKARRLLRWTGRLTTILSRAGIDNSLLDEAINFFNDPNDVSRLWHLSDRLGAKHEKVDDDLYRLQLDESFPLDLQHIFIYQPATDLAPHDVLSSLRARPEIHSQVTVVVSNERLQDEVFRLAGREHGSQIVVPSAADMTALLLSRQPSHVLARIVASQVQRAYVSPYQVGGGVRRDSMFFGRRELLAHILNRELSNYLVVGARQIGKTSLLRAVYRRLQVSSDIESHLIVLANASPIRRMVRSLGLGREAGISEIVDHLASQDRERLFLVDEADQFIRDDSRKSFEVLAQLRRLSEEGHCHFILTGFSDLYHAAAVESASPLMNFGEMLTIGALEEDACYEMATVPMSAMGIHYTSKDLVESIIQQTGRRPNLISIVCNEILKILPAEGREISSEVIEQVLLSDVFDFTLDWINLGDTVEENRFVRALVYKTIWSESFTLAELLPEMEKDLGHHLEKAHLERLLKRLELAFVLAREGVDYRYLVPLFVDRVRAQKPEEMLARELLELRR